MTQLIEKAYDGLYPGKIFLYQSRLIYSGKFFDYNANIRIVGTRMEIRLSRKWERISEEIVIGLIQDLIQKVFNRKNKIRTMNTDLYENFLKNIHIAIPKNKSHPILEDSYNRINDKYFYGLLERPNLVWGINSKRRMGSYTFGTDTIQISKILHDAPLRLLDYVMYHEALHKKHKFKTNGMRNSYHDTLFKKDERKFDRQEDAEKELENFLKTKRVRSIFGFFSSN